LDKLNQDHAVLISKHHGGGMRNNKLAYIIGILALLTVVLTACTGGAAAPTLLPAEPQAAVGPDLSDEPSQPAQDSVAAENPAEELVQAVPRQGLEATDPASVVLASGQPQIVEFFAYW
jgi:hypothetical protein